MWEWGRIVGRREIMRIANWSLLAAGAALSITACGVATTVGTDFDPSLDLGRYSTFGWDEEAIPQARDVRLENNPFFRDRLFEAVARELSERGIRRDEASPELLAHYHVSVEDHVEVFEVDPQLNDVRSEYGPGTDVIQYEQGTVVLHFIDAATEETLWVGWAQGDIGPALTASIKMREWVDGAVAKMFKDFPVLTVPRGR
jgi:hypothetical protein